MEQLTIWEQYTVTLCRDPRKGFGIAITGGTDRSLDADTSVIVSDIVPGGPADGRLQIRDRIVMVNGVSMENKTSSFAIHSLKSCFKVANVTVKRPRTIQIPGSKSVPSVSTRQPHSPQVSCNSEHLNSDSPDNETRLSPAWQEKYENSNNRHHEDMARGYEGDSSSGRSSGGSVNDLSYHSRQQKLGRGHYSKKMADKEKPCYGRESPGSNRSTDTCSIMAYSETDDYLRTRSENDFKERPHSGLELVSGFKRLPIQDIPSKPVKTVLLKQSETQEYGLKLGSQIFIKHITDMGLAAQEKSLQEGDLILKINGVTSENMSLADTRRLIEKSKDKLTLTVLRDNRQFLVNLPQINDSDSEDRSSVHNDISELSSEQSLPPSHLPPPPTKQAHQNSLERQESPVNIEGTHAMPTEKIPQGNERISPPLVIDNTGHSKQDHGKEKDDLRLGYSPDARLVQFIKGKSIGLRLAGGNDVGIFVAAVQEGSLAAQEGMKEGDQILQVNETSFHNMTREDAVQYLIGLPQYEEIILLTQGKEDIYRKMIKSNVGDSFYIRTHFEYEAETPSGLSFTRGEIFHVLDTMYRGKLGSWLAVRVGRDLKETDKGIIPNRSRAEQYASLENVLKSQSTLVPRTDLWKLKGLTGAKKILKKSREELAAITSKAKYPPYEKVVLKEANFKRPVVVLGPISDIAHIKLCSELPKEFEAAESVARDDGNSKIIKLQAVREIAERDKHALLDITATAVEHLNYVQFYPIVVFCNPENRKGVKAMRQWLLPESKKSSRRLYSQAVKLRKSHSHLFSAIINLSGASDSWFRSLKEIIQTEQGRPIWTPEDKAENYVNETLDLMNESTVQPTDYLSCDSRANSDYEETDAEGGPYTDQEEDDYQVPALARSSEPVVQSYHNVSTKYDPSYSQTELSDDYIFKYGNLSLSQSPSEVKWKFIFDALNDANHQKYLWFALDGLHLQFVALPIALSSTPMVFTKVLAGLMAFLRSQGMHIIPYLDDLFIWAQSFQEAQKDTLDIVRMSDFLFLINEGPRKGLPPAKSTISRWIKQAVETDMKSQEISDTKNRAGTNRSVIFQFTINVLELSLCMSHWPSSLRGLTVIIQLDNLLAIACVNQEAPGARGYFEKIAGKGKQYLVWFTTKAFKIILTASLDSKTHSGCSWKVCSQLIGTSLDINRWNYEHDALQKKFNHARSTSSQEEEHEWSGPATDL
ncbi:tight junction protein ZO-3 [Gastrophryne carolinensis]